VPPVADKVKVVPSLPAIVTCDALVAVTVKTEEAPAAMDVGLAVIVTVGAGFAVTLTFSTAVVVPPIPEALAV
jgi:hypothetical protein